MAIDISGRTPGADLARRERPGISADDLAARAGISVQDLTSYEQAKAEGDADPVVAMKIADALDAIEREQGAQGNGRDELLRDVKDEIELPEKGSA